MENFDWSLVCILKYGDQLKSLTTNLSITSVVVSWVCLFLRLLDRRNDRFPARVATLTVLIGALYSVNVLIGYIVNYNQIDGDKGKYHDLCLGQGIVFQFLALWLVACWNFIGVLTYQVVVKRWRTARLQAQEKYFHSITWPLILLFTFVPVIASNKGWNIYGPESGISSCYLETVDDQIGYLYGLMAVTLFIGVVMSLRVFWRLYTLVKSEYHRTRTPSGTRSSLLSSLFRSTNDLHESSESEGPGTPNTSQAAISMSYHLLRHLLFLIIFAFVFFTVILDAVNRLLDKNADTEQSALNRRFPSAHPCGTTFVATAATSSIGLFVGVVFFRWPGKAVNHIKSQLFRGSNRTSSDYIDMTEEEESDTDDLSDKFRSTESTS